MNREEIKDKIEQLEKELSELKEQMGGPDPITYREKETIYYPGEYGIKSRIIISASSGDKIHPFRFVKGESYNRFQKLVMIQNFVDRKGGDFFEVLSSLIFSDYIKIKGGFAYFMPDIEVAEISKEAIEYFGEDFFKSI